MLWSHDEDARLRREAIAWLTVRSNDGQTPLSTDDISDFSFDGQPFRLLDRQRGITKPALLPHALSLRTVFTPEGKRPPYEDSAERDGVIFYKWRGTDGEHPENKSIRDAMRAQVPLIWFVGVKVALYLPVFPVFVVTEQPERHQFGLQLAELPAGTNREYSPVEAVLAKRYLVQVTKRRLHQPMFRSRVISAYTSRCSVCSLGHAKLLDAAHIIPDADEDSSTSVRNGLALCKIHHAAYDSNIMGISPDLTVGIRPDILDEVDGPMLRHGLQELDGSPLRVVPRSRQERPDPALLDVRWTQFRAI